ncbi:MAG: sunset domain-containing protein [Aeromicrobium sp.]
MRVLLWIILILLVVGILWWFYSRNRSSGGSSAPAAPATHAAHVAPVPPDSPPTTSSITDETASGSPIHSVSTGGSHAAPVAEPAARQAAPATEAAPAAGRFGAGSADPGPDGSGPEGWNIKANEESMKYHTADSPWYGRTVAETWFESEEHAQAAGFKRWDDQSQE